MKREEKALLYVNKIKDPKVRAALRRDLEELIRLKEERDRTNKIRKYHDKYRSTKLH